MRIIAGSHRGRGILGPQDASVTRPITDPVKEALFNRLMSLGMLAGPPQEEAWSAVDAFCGTGSLGLECLSRGAAHCTFIEQDRGALEGLRENLDTLGLTDRARVLPGSALMPTWAATLGEGGVRLVFLDPPYKLVEDVGEVGEAERLFALFPPLLERLEAGGLIVLRTPAGYEAGEVAGYDGPVTVRYGSQALHFYQRPLGEEAV